MDETRDLVERARGGDRRAAEQLLRAHQSLAYTTALRLVADSMEAEEIAQEALLRAHTRLDELRDASLYAAWLRRMTANLAVTRLRRRGRIRFESLDRHVYDDAGRERAHALRDERAIAPEEAVIQLLESADIQALLATLPAEQRVAVVLRDMYGYEIAEVAELVRCGLSAAKMRVSRGRAALRTMIESKRVPQ